MKNLQAVAYKPARTDWYRERGLTRKVTKVLTEGRGFYPKGLGPGDVWEYDEITTYYCAGRIDIRDSEKEGRDSRWYNQVTNRAERLMSRLEEVE